MRNPSSPPCRTTRSSSLFSPSSRAYSSLALLLCAAILSSCAKESPRPFERIAVVPFENHTGRPDLDWTGTALAALTVSQTHGDGTYRTFEAPDATEARLTGADRILTGHLEHRGDQLLLRGEIRDRDNRRTLQRFSATAPPGDIAQLATAAAAVTGAPVRPTATRSPDALRLYATARLSQDSSSALADARQAVAAAPQFGPARILLAELLIRSGSPEEARSTISSALSQNPDRLQAARLKALLARLDGDLTRQASALTELASAEGVHARQWRTVAEAQLILKDYKAAALATTRALELEPGDEALLNLRVYAHGLAGDAGAARNAAEEYRKAFPASANPIDTLAEVLFYLRQYRDAAELFLEADSKDPNILGGAEPFRAAYSRFLAGDLRAGDELYAKYEARLRKRGDALVTARRALWTRMTGRTPEPAADAASLVDQSLWLTLEGNREAARTTAATAIRTAAAPALKSLAGVALLLAQPTAPPASWETRIASALPGDAAANARRELLAWALLLDRHYADSARVFEELWNRANPTEATLQRIGLAWALTSAGQSAEARRVMPHGWFPPREPEPGFPALAWPKAPQLSAVK